MLDHTELSLQLCAIAALRRPRLLVRAARAGQVDYNRNRDLRGLIDPNLLSRPETLLNALLENDAQLEAARQAGAVEYNVTRHVAVLIALMAEARAYHALCA
ncbi:MAG TPA: DUF6477 family protein [Paenirhodobacter sp.]